MVPAELTTVVRRAAGVYARRRDAAAARPLLRRQGEIEQVAAAVYFADGPVNLYQIDQWYAPFVELASSTPMAVITRNISTARLLLERGALPVLFAETSAHVERWLARQRIGAVFYVNQNLENFSMLRFREPAHVFVSHGESEKDYMATNQLKAYDYTFVAGPAARQRLRQRLIGYDVDRRTVPIGRPQVDVPGTPPPLPTDGRRVVLYAPTWEGDRPSMEYSSLLSHGPALVRALVADPGQRVIYRPHPRTGSYDRRYRAAHTAIERVVAHANRADPGAQHLIDTGASFGWQVRCADACVTDVSAVAYDCVAAGTPLVLTRPVSADAVVDEDGLASVLPTLTAASAGGIVEAIERAVREFDAGRQQELARHYFGDVSPGSSMRRFVAAVEDVIATRRAELASQPGPAGGRPPSPQ